MPGHDKAVRQTSPDVEADLQLITDAAREAGQIAMRYFGKNPKVWMKEGNSPVSEADHAANACLEKTLMAARPDYGWLSEETTDNKERLGRERVFIVDPIDGTKGFINGSNQWCVSVAVVDAGRPLCGVLECPALGETYKAAEGGGALLNGYRLSKSNTAPNRLMAGPPKLLQTFKQETGEEIKPAPFIPSLAYRLAMVASDALVSAFARANSHDWDIAAADLILQEAGAALVGADGEKIKYNCTTITHGVLIAAAIDNIEPMLRAARLEDIS